MYCIQIEALWRASNPTGLFVTACAGRGAFPIKFNGSIFTAPHLGDPDYRRWGPGYWWQNTRLPYLSMCAAGDYDLMRPLYRMFLAALPLRKAATRAYYGHDGAFEDVDGDSDLDLLAPVYAWFTEGFDTRDLKEAKVLLEALA